MAGILALCQLWGCSSSGGEAQESDSGAFIAFAQDFQGFRMWNAYSVPDGAAQGSVHLAGPRTVYLNKKPPKGSIEFPVGTVIVKELEVGTLAERKVFAIVKRGGGYNSAGVPGWEWFELQNNPDGSVAKIVWRGLGPPLGEQYGGDPTGCTGCHGAAKANDYVQTSALLLSTF